MALRYDNGLFPEAPVQIFEIEEKNKAIKFYLVREQATNKRGYVFALDGDTGRRNQDIIYNQDGRSVRRVVLTQNSWTVLGLAFTNPLDFSDFRGSYRITSPILFNSISLYQITEQDEAERFAYRKWYAVRSEPDNVLDWQYWRDLDGQPDPDPDNPGGFLDYTWSEVLFLSESEPTVLDPGKIYKQYVGTDRLVFEDNSTLSLGNYRYSTFKDVKWSRQILDSA